MIRDFKISSVRLRFGGPDGHRGEQRYQITEIWSKLPWRQKRRNLGMICW